jgi:hypothetical protein
VGKPGRTWSTRGERGDPLVASAKGSTARHAAGSPDTGASRRVARAAGRLSLGAADPAPPGTALCLALFRVRVGAPALVTVNPCLIPPPTAATPGACRPPWPTPSARRHPRDTSRPRPRPPGPTPKPSPSPALLIDHGVGKVPPWSPSDAESIHRKLTAYSELRRDRAGMGKFKSGTARHRDPRKQLADPLGPVAQPGQTRGRGVASSLIATADVRAVGLCSGASALARGAHAIVAGHHARPEGWTKTPAWEPVERVGDFVALVVPHDGSPCPAPTLARCLGGAGSFPVRPPTGERPSASAESLSAKVNQFGSGARMHL